jgi:hypothetical protein
MTKNSASHLEATPGEITNAQKEWNVVKSRFVFIQNIHDV